MFDVDYLKNALRVRHDRDDAYLADLEAFAVSHAGRVSGRYLGALEERTVYLAGHGRPTLYLEGPVAVDVSTGLALVSMVTERAHPGEVGTELVAAEEDGWLVRGNALVRKNGHRWIYGWEYEVTYSRDGEADVPGGIQQAVLQLVALWYEHRVPLAQVQVLQELPYGPTQLLLSHRRPLV